MKKNVVINLLGTTLDQGKHAGRWNKWRPSVSICQQPDLLISEYYLLYQRRFQSLALQVEKDINQVSPETNVHLYTIEMEDPWDFEEVYSTILDVSEDLEFDPDKNEYLIHITTGTHVAQICLFLLTESHHLPGKLLQTSPPKRKNQDQHIDSAGTYSIIDLDLAKYDRLAMRFKQQKLDDISFLKSGIQTRNNAFNELIEEIETVSIRSADPILITGATGAGKSQLAKRIFELKSLHNQIQGRFVEVNCATLRGDSAMSTLFGHKRGSFTGAIQDRAGLLKASDKGVCFLDEIAELGLDEQAMLLRAIEEKTFLPLGSDTEDSSNFQLICGTNKDLKARVIQGAFREDLFARINFWTFRIPNLKDRPEDISPNIDYELIRYAEETGMKISFNKEAKETFHSFSVSKQAVWESNFRDLNGAIRRMATLAPGGRITEEIVKIEIDRLKKLWQKESGRETSVLEQVLSPQEINDLDLFDQITLSAVLHKCKECNSVSEAGRVLFNISRNNKQNQNDADRLAKYLKKFGILWADL